MIRKVCGFCGGLVPMVHWEFCSPACKVAAQRTRRRGDTTPAANCRSRARAAETLQIGDVIDLGPVPRPGPLYLVILTEVEIITAGAPGTISFALASDAQAAIATMARPRCTSPRKTS